MEKRKELNFKKHSNKESELSNEIERFIEKLKKSQDEEFRFWKESVDPDLSKITIPLYIRNDVLFIKVPDDVRRFELTRKKDEILKKVKTSLIKNNIQDIVFI